MTRKENQKTIERVLILSGTLNLLLGIFKILVGHFSFSKALFVDGIHSLSDVFTDVFVYVMSKISHDDPDDEHPYGHHRFETLGTVVIGVILLFVAFALIYENVSVLLGKETLQVKPGKLALYLTAISIIVKEGIFRYTNFIGKKLNSKLLIANAWHSRSDAISSIIVFIGLIFSINGVENVDVFAAVIVSVFIGKIGAEFLWDGVKELVDTGLNKDEVLAIESEINSVDGVLSLHNLRSRKMGSQAILDVNIEVSDLISVTEGHQIASWVAKLVTQKFTNVNDITVHVDTEDDRSEGDFIHDHTKDLLPLRSSILSTGNLADVLENQDVKRVMLHYLGDYVLIDILITNESEQIKIIEDSLKKVISLSSFDIKYTISLIVSSELG